MWGPLDPLPVRAVAYALAKQGCDCCQEESVHMIWVDRDGHAVDVRVDPLDVPVFVERLQAMTASQASASINGEAVAAVKFNLTRMGEEKMRGEDKDHAEGKDGDDGHR